MLAKGVATVFSAPARIMMKKECLVESEIIKNTEHWDTLASSTMWNFTHRQFLFVAFLGGLEPVPADSARGRIHLYPGRQTTIHTYIRVTD